MEMRQLRYFVAVAEELNFTKAATRLHISQPPLSRQIALLEGEIEVQLFSRNKQRVELTSAGREFLPEARRTLDCAQTAVATAMRAAKGELGRLAIAFGGSAAYTFLPALLRTFHSQFPGVRISLVNLPMTGQLKALLDQSIDVGLLITPIKHPAIASVVKTREPLVAALPSGHPLAGKSRIRLRALAPYGHVVFNRTGGGFYSSILAYCRRAGYEPTVIEESPRIESVIGFVACGMGVAVVPGMARKLDIADVVYVPLEESYAALSYALAWRKENRNAALHALIEMAHH